MLGESQLGEELGTALGVQGGPDNFGDQEEPSNRNGDDAEPSDSNQDAASIPAKRQRALREQEELSSKRLREGTEKEVLELLLSCAALGKDLADSAPATKDQDEGYIMEQVRQVRATAAEALADAPSEVQHLAAAGVALYKTRLSDIGIREQVFLLHLIDGGRQIRAHKGSLFMYQDGAWQLFTGVVPESLLLRFRRFLLRLEGMFLVLAEKNDRLESERELLAAGAAAVGEMGELTTVEILESLDQEALQKGSYQEEVAGEHRLLSAAKRTARISTTLQKELMHKTLLTLFCTSQNGVRRSGLHIVECVLKTLASRSTIMARWISSSRGWTATFMFT